LGLLKLKEGIKKGLDRGTGRSRDGYLWRPTWEQGRGGWEEESQGVTKGVGVKGKGKRQCGVLQALLAPKTGRKKGEGKRKQLMKGESSELEDSGPAALHRVQVEKVRKLGGHRKEKKGIVRKGPEHSFSFCGTEKKGETRKKPESRGMVKMLMMERKTTFPKKAERD